MGDFLRSDSLPRLRAALPWLGLLAVAALSIPPLLLERPPVEPVAPYADALLAGLSKAVVLLVMFGVIRVAVWSAGAEDSSAIRVEMPLVLLAALMTAWHWHHLDSGDFFGGWQREMYFKIFNHTQEPPHQFRALPYGFARSLERLTGDWTFSCVAYR